MIRCRSSSSGKCARRFGPRHGDGAETIMTAFMRARSAHRLVAGVAIAATICGGIGLAAASASNIKLVGVSAQATGRTAAVLIEATEPVAYAVTRPDPLTVLVDLRNVTVADAANQVGRQGPVAGVTLEQATGVDGKDLARVRVALASPAEYKVRSVRNVIRLEIEPAMPAAFAPAAPPMAAALPLPIEEVTTASSAPAPRAAAPAATPTPSAPAAEIAVATELQKIHASHTRTATTVILAGNGRLNPSSLSEAEGLPRRISLDFPNVSFTTAPRTSVEGSFVKNVRVASGLDPSTTRVTMEIATNTTYHVERTGPDGRDLALIVEGANKANANKPATVAPPSRPAPGDEYEKIPLAQALANGASLAPPDPIAALDTAAPAKPPAVAAAAASQPGPLVAPPASRTARSAQSAQQQPPPPQQPPATPPAGQPTFSTEVPGSGQKQYTGHPINFDFEDADLRAVLRVFSSESGLKMITAPQVQRRVNVLMNDVPWDQALDQILRSNKLGCAVEGNIIRIAPLSVLAS